MYSILPISLGCPKNLTDMETMLGIIASKGYPIVQDEASADIVLLNTCAFIKPAVDESKSEINRILKLKRSGKIQKLIVTGCLVQREINTIRKEFPEIDAVVGIGGLKNILKALENSQNVLPRLPDKLDYFEHKYIATLPHTAYLKIADGCDNHCSYCTIPSIRGGYRSKTISDIIIEAEKLAGSGVKEISLIAQDTTRYGIDLYDKVRLVSLLKSLAKLTGLKWIRLMYTYPEGITDELLKFMADEPKICRYLDMPLQHISGKILKSMRRKSSESEIYRKIDKIRAVLPGIAIRTNFIVGYPGETDADFAKLKQFIKEVRFNKLGVFTYWQEKGTPAADLPEQISDKVKKERYAEIINIQSRVIDKMNKGMTGKILNVLMDSPPIGRSKNEAPGIDGFIEVSGNKLSPGSFIPVKITGARGYQLKGETVT